MTNNKLVIRRLPPFMSEDDFLKQVSPLPKHDYFCFFEANPGLGSHSFSRAYINFLDFNDMINFRERFDNYIFLDKDGHEYSAVVEQSFWQKSPKDGPFCKSNGQNRPLLSTKSNGIGSAATDRSGSYDSKNAEAPLAIEQDPDFIDFIEKNRAQKRGIQQSPIQTLETNLDELTNSSNSASAKKKDASKIVTPLIGYVNQKRMLKNNKKNKK